MVLLRDAAHTAHFSIGSGTKLAMEDAIALASAFERYSQVEAALAEYELERRPIVERFQQAAQESRLYFETTSTYLGLEPLPFAVQLLTRSGRISYDDLRPAIPASLPPSSAGWWSGARAPLPAGRPSSRPRRC